MSHLPSWTLNWSHLVLCNMKDVFPQVVGVRNTTRRDLDVEATRKITKRTSSSPNENRRRDEILLLVPEGKECPKDFASF